MKTQCVKTSVRPSCAQLDAGGWLVSKNKLGRRQTIHLDEDVSDGVVCLANTEEINMSGVCFLLTNPMPIL